MNNLPNTMTIGAGPYDGPERPATFSEFLEDIRIEKRDLKDTHFYFRTGDYSCSFDANYDKLEERFVVTNIICCEGNYPVCSSEIDRLREHVEYQFDCLPYREDLFETLSNILK